jgi:hypothetical protein
MGGGLPLIRVKQRRLADGGRRTDSSDSGRRLLAFRWLRETSRSVRPTQVRSPASEDRRLFCSRSRPRAWQATEHHKTTAALTRPASQPAGGHGRHPVPARSPDLARVRHHRAATRTGSSSWLRSRLVSWLALRSSETRRSVHSHAGLTCVRTRAPAHARHLHHHHKHPRIAPLALTPNTRITAPYPTYPTYATTYAPPAPPPPPRTPHPPTHTACMRCYHARGGGGLLWVAAPLPRLRRLLLVQARSAGCSRASAPAEPAASAAP